MNEALGVSSFAPVIKALPARMQQYQMPNESWLSEVRSFALQNFTQFGLPDTTYEDWRYTSLRGLRELQFHSDDTEVINDGDLAEIAAQIAKVPPGLVFVNGILQAKLSQINTTKHLRIQSVQEILREEPNLLNPFFSQTETPDINQTFEQLNRGLFLDGYYLEVSAPEGMDKPIFMHFFASKDNESARQKKAARAFFVRNFINVKPGAKLHIHEVHYEDRKCAAPYFSSSHTQIQMQDESELHLCRIQNQHTGSFNFNSTDVQMQRGCQFKNLTVDLGAKLCRNAINVTINKHESDATLLGLYLNGEQQQTTNHVNINHVAGGSRSFQLYKGILKDKSRAVFKGKIWVNKLASATVAQQTNKTILLSETAEVDTQPILQIDNDDVKCNHGAAVGQLNQEEMFYLQTRGMTANQAQGMLAQAFVSEVLQRFGLSVTPEYLQAAIDNFLNRES